MPREPNKTRGLVVLPATAVLYAQDKLGVREDYVDGKWTNWGPEIQEFLKAANINAPAAWCGAFVNWCAEQAALDHGVVSPLESVKLQGYVQSYADWARETNRFVDPNHTGLGDLFVLYYPSLNRYAHIGFVVEINTAEGWFKTIEGNGLPVDTPVLTPLGWVPIGSLKLGDRVISPYNEPSIVTAIFPQGLRNTYTLEFSDGTTVVADENHLWKVYCDARTGPEKTWTTLQVLEFLNKGRRLYLPEIDPIEFSTKDLPLDPYVLGVLLGDGGLTRPSSVKLTSIDPEILRVITERLPNGCELHHYTKSDYGITGAPIHNALRELGVSGKGADTKFIPPAYKNASVSQRMDLLQGLLDTDGSIDVLGRIEFCSISEQLAIDVQELVQSLGGKVAVYRKRKITYTSPTQKTKKAARDAYVLKNIRFPKKSNIEPFKLPRKAARVRIKDKARVKGWAIRSVTPKGKEETVCITISAPSQMYVIQNYIPTHNTDDEASREGYKVATRRRNITERVKFIRWD